jgi:hypothetical protein
MLAGLTPRVKPSGPGADTPPHHGRSVAPAGSVSVSRSPRPGCRAAHPTTDLPPRIAARSFLTSDRALLTSASPLLTSASLAPTSASLLLTSASLLLTSASLLLTSASLLLTSLFAAPDLRVAAPDLRFAAPDFRFTAPDLRARAPDLPSRRARSPDRHPGPPLARSRPSRACSRSLMAGSSLSVRYSGFRTRDRAARATRPFVHVRHPPLGESLILLAKRYLAHNSSIPSQNISDAWNGVSCLALEKRKKAHCRALHLARNDAL